MDGAQPFTAAQSARARRDLDWLLQHAPILNDCQKGSVNWLGPSGISALQPALQSFVDDLPDQALEAALQERRSGRYFEALVVALLRGSQRFEVLAHDLQVREDKRTVGAFDVVLRDLQQDMHIHLELAYKQYLHRKGDPALMQNWVGPRGRDRLDLKYNHMQERQLQLGSTPAGQACLRSLGIQHYQRWALMSGRLFSPWEEFMAGRQPDLPVACATSVEWGWWLSVEQQRELEQAQGVAYLLPPRCAIAPIQAEDCEHLECLEWPRVQQLLDLGIPSLVALTRDGVESSRGWIVA